MCRFGGNNTGLSLKNHALGFKVLSVCIFYIFQPNSNNEMITIMIIIMIPEIIKYRVSIRWGIVCLMGRKNPSALELWVAALLEMVSR